MNEMLVEETSIEHDTSAVWRNISNQIINANKLKVILIIDDRFFVRMFINKILDRSDYELHHSLDAMNGFNFAKAIQPDLIILDAQMPGYPDGKDFCKLIKSCETLQSTKLLFITRVKNIESNYDILNSGADDYVVIPFSPLDLIRKTSKLLELNRGR
jgi:DNA-binding response OmpR family regulator